MALTVHCTTDRILSIDEYLGRIEQIDLRDIDSIAASAPMLRALANDRTLVVKKLNERVQVIFTGAEPASAQSIVLGKREGFYVRANIWPANSDMANGRAYQNQFAYNLAHDHNFTFMTLNYLGPGYETEIYEYEYDRVQGYVGETVDLRFLEKVKFTSGSAMIYRANKDVHVQYAPEELTVTLNLMVAPPKHQFRDQFHFDVVRKTITGHPDELLATRRISLITLAGYVGDGNTGELLADLAKEHPCRRTRLAAYEALCRQRPADVADIWRSATQDAAPLVSNVATKKLREIETA